jgi:SAM-dependent methyltransferase
MTSSAETQLLQELNRNLPPGVDWQQGALDYMAARLRESDADLNRRYHLMKPFTSVFGETVPINQQLQECIRELSFFLNVLSLLSLSPQTKFLDVACGSGWIVQFLAKLNLAVVGTDISPDMIALTRERLALDSLPTVHGEQFERVDLLVHNIEQSALPSEYHCDVAILESALHHFVNPIQSLRHIAASLNDRGIVIILEAASDGSGDDYYLEIMQKYNTLERPYSRAQLHQILQLAGFAEFEFVHPVNGFFSQKDSVGRQVNDEIVHSQSWNTVIAAKQAGSLQSLNLIGNVGEIGIKGDLQAMLTLSRSVARKTMAKVMRRKGR